MQGVCLIFPRWFALVSFECKKAFFVTLAFGPVYNLKYRDARSPARPTPEGTGSFERGAWKKLCVSVRNNPATAVQGDNAFFRQSWLINALPTKGCYRCRRLFTCLGCALAHDLSVAHSLLE